MNDPRLDAPLVTRQDGARGDEPGALAPSSAPRGPSWRRRVLVILITLAALVFFTVGACWVTVLNVPLFKL